MRSERAILLIEPPQGGAFSQGEHSRNAGAAPAISIEIATPERFLSLGREWRALTCRAIADNVFMEPALIAAAAQADAVPVHVLLGWAAKERSDGSRLVGAWALARRRPSSNLPLSVLKAPVHGHACLGIPVLAADRPGETLSCMLEAIADAPDLPKLIEINGLDDAGPLAAVFAEVLALRASAYLRLEARCRPQLVKGEAEAAPLAASRKRALRQKRKRLDKRGQVTVTTHTAPEEVRAAIDEFLALEMAGWKGKAIERGHALRRYPALESFFRGAVAGLAAEGRVGITALRSDGRPIAMQVTAHSGATAFTWKSAYDEAQRDCAPGILLLQEVTDALLSDPAVKVVDSCNHRDDGYMAEFWSGRKPVLDMVLDARRGMTPAFRVLGSAEWSLQQLKIEARRAHRALRAARDGMSSRLRSALSRLGFVGVGPEHTASGRDTG